MLKRLWFRVWTTVYFFGLVPFVYVGQFLFDLVGTIRCGLMDMCSWVREDFILNNEGLGWAFSLWLKNFKRGGVEK